LNLRGRK